MDNRKFVEDATRAHNEYRSRHKVGSLKHNKDITTMAQKWADHLASTGTFQHCPDRKFKGETVGENIAMKWTSGGDDFTGQQVTNQWYSEVSKYNHSHGGGSGTGHFTQVVWKDSKEFGIGRAKGKDGKWIVVGNYVPAGNFAGRYRENVFPPKDGKTSLIGDDEKPSGGANKGFAFVHTHHKTIPQKPVPHSFCFNTKQMTVGPKDDHTSRLRNRSQVPFSGPPSQHLTPPAHVQASRNIRITHKGHNIDNERRCQYNPSDSRMHSRGGDFGGAPFSSGFSHFSGFDSGASGRQGMAMDFPRASGFDQSSSTSSSSGQVVSRQTKTVTEGVGANRKTKTIVTETIVAPDGSKKTVTTETVSSG